MSSLEIAGIAFACIFGGSGPPTSSAVTTVMATILICAPLGYDAA